MLLFSFSLCFFLLNVSYLYKNRLTIITFVKGAHTMYNNYGSLATKVYELTKPAGASINGDIDYYIERLEV